MLFIMSDLTVQFLAKVFTLQFLSVKNDCSRAYKLAKRDFGFFVCKPFFPD